MKTARYCSYSFLAANRVGELVGIPDRLATTQMPLTSMGLSRDVVVVQLF